MIDIVGHFGSTLSYATVASVVARRFKKEGILGVVVNMDDRWSDAHKDLAPEPNAKLGSHVIVMSTPRHYFDAFARERGRDRSAIFACPNTDRVGKEYAETVSKFGVALVPSTWCEDVVGGYARPGEIVRLPLGVDDAYLNVGGFVTGKVYHFTTDRWWPGRKGTEELLEAWKIAVTRSLFERPYKLHIHSPEGLETKVMYQIADLGLTDSVVVEAAGERGSSDAELIQHMANAAFVVQPSRCEGFGMMLLAALVAGVPLLATPVTGQRDFLMKMPGWVALPTGGMESMVSEEGFAPSLDPEALATSLALGLSDYGYRMMMRGVHDARATAALWTWSVVLERWVEWAQQWLKETS